ncbi:ABC transporter substrate-binding protein [Pararoseomonas indoligenes]|uniref:ABC transporter substrate-binding protein n=1 Tax=Roseomonas indoligenes TaxID=2820811 RepID=A0A940N365_9PROT|nr:ABC transporter substrate-binding protein [Pararoseomonas indoligenes]MBP0495915.1 ABC transporter substrate-binding protein [Pararoseomonas indoligenes]
MRALVRVAALGLLGTALAAAPGQAQTVLRGMIASDIRGLMPGISTDVATGAVLQHLYEGLVAWRSDGSVAPMLAERIETSDDGRAVTFTLREGLRFHNGAPFTSAEVAWTWNRYLDPKAAWPCRTNFDGSRQLKITGVETDGPLRVTFRLAEPSPVFLSMMARSDCDSSGIAHPDSVDAEGRWTRAIGTGPFRLEEWRRGQFVQLARFDGYVPRSEPADGLAGGKRALVDRLRFTLIPDPSAARVALQAGNLDVVQELEPTVAKELQSVPGLRILHAPTAGLNTILIRGTDPVLADARVRQAIIAATDSADMREGLYQGFGAPGGSLVPTASRYYGAAQKEEIAYDPARAAGLLRQGGYRGQPITITTNSQFGLMKDTAILLQAQLQAAGMNARVEVLEFGAQLQRYTRGDYQLMIWNITPYLDPVFTFDRFIGPAEGPADKVWRNPAANEALARLSALPEGEARQPAFDALHRLFLQDAPLMVWTNRETISGVRANVRGFEPWPGLKPRFWNVSVMP